MTEDLPPRRSRGRNSSPELIARLQRSRQRSLARRAAEAEREKNITAAVGEYLDAWNAIVRIEQRRDGEVARLREQIENVIAHAATEIADHERDQGAAAAAIRAQVHTDSEVADLLEITRARVRQLLADYRATGAGRDRGVKSAGQDDSTQPSADSVSASRMSPADTGADESVPTARGSEDASSPE